MSERSVTIHRGVEQNIISLVPPLSEGERDALMETGVVSETMVGNGDVDGEPATMIYFGRLIMGTTPMDKATDQLAGALRQQLASLDQLA